MLQSENIDVCSAVETIDRTRQAMIEMRSDKGFKQALVDTRYLCNSIEIEAEFQEPEVRALKKKKQYDYEALYEAPPKENNDGGYFGSSVYMPNLRLGPSATSISSVLPPYS
ncbi:hypothetical protein AVEN_170102-1 [Araneus ventricosus]|uniref:Uncharacterized protein n=1 Tax=Araneus ventricosus TaxID=182803 RepID=A0A4Y2SXD1_ARAVE|nr:hypothetical protein AVEN_36556-1 [Araneus ventricosus]GBN91829.1 hypothetical protein AVEN_170102-1 [Araneus ventricosus]